MMQDKLNELIEKTSSLHGLLKNTTELDAELAHYAKNEIIKCVSLINYLIDYYIIHECGWTFIRDENLVRLDQMDKRERVRIKLLKNITNLLDVSCRFKIDIFKNIIDSLIKKIQGTVYFSQKQEHILFYYSVDRIINLNTSICDLGDRRPPIKIPEMMLKNYLYEKTREIFSFVTTYDPYSLRPKINDPALDPFIEAFCAIYTRLRSNDASGTTERDEFETFMLLSNHRSEISKV